jgi:hypothetical protein
VGVGTGWAAGMCNGGVGGIRNSVRTSVVASGQQQQHQGGSSVRIATAAMATLRTVALRQQSLHGQQQLPQDGQQ